MLYSFACKCVFVAALTIFCDVIECRSQLCIIVIIRNRLFVNNSGNPELIRAKFFTTMGLWWDTSLDTLGALGQWRPKWPKTYQTVLSGRRGLQNAISQRPIFIRFGYNMWIDVVINPFEKQLRIFPKMGHLPPKPTFDVCFSGCLVHSLETNWQVFESKWPFHVIVQGQRMCLFRVTFCIVRFTVLEILYAESTKIF